MLVETNGRQPACCASSLFGVTVASTLCGFCLICFVVSWAGVETTKSRIQPHTECRMSGDSKSILIGDLTKKIKGKRAVFDSLYLRGGYRVGKWSSVVRDTHPWEQSYNGGSRLGSIVG